MARQSIRPGRGLPIRMAFCSLLFSGVGAGYAPTTGPVPVALAAASRPHKPPVRHHHVAHAPQKPAPAQSVAVRACAWQANTLAYLGDANAYYWHTDLYANPWVTLTITGTYPSARYVSLQAYTDTVNGVFIDGLHDTQYPPDRGSVNPFVAGTPRGIGTYTLHVLFAARPAVPAPGTLYLPLKAGTLVRLLYRLYLPDAGQNTAGGVPLPGIIASNRVNGTPLNCPDTSPISATPTATPSPLVATATPPPAAPSAPQFVRKTGDDLGGYNNSDAAYLQATLPATTTLYVIRFKEPTAPHTLYGGPVNATYQVRYWSICFYLPDGLAYRCLADEQVAADATGAVTIVAGPWWAQPTNINAAAGMNWVSLGWFTTPFTSLIRNLIPSSSFAPMSIFAVPDNAPASAYMGTYAPMIVQCSRAQFQANTCP